MAAVLQRDSYSQEILTTSWTNGKLKRTDWVTNISKDLQKLAITSQLPWTQDQQLIGNMQCKNHWNTIIQNNCPYIPSVDLELVAEEDSGTDEEGIDETLPEL